MEPSRKKIISLDGGNNMDIKETGWEGVANDKLS
jgi:hypothetical protein